MIDGLTGEFYKKYQDQIGPVLQKVYSECLRENKIPPTWQEARIIVIPKIWKDLSLPENYSPISLLNQDYKIMAIITARLNQIISSSLHRDQAGFIKGHCIRDRIRQVLNIIDWSKYTKEMTLLYVIDANKAFERVGWLF